MDLTTAGLIAKVELDALLPDGMYNEEDIISFLNDAYYSEVLPFVMRHREDFYVAYEDFDPAASINIPVDAIAQKLKDVQLKTSSNRFQNLPRLSMGEVTSNNGNANAQGFYIQDNTIVFYPNIPSHSVRLVYFKRPYPMIDSGDDTVYTVTEIDGTSAILNKAPAVGTLTLSLSKFYQPYDTVDMSGEGSITTNNHIVLSEEDIAKVTVGDIFCPRGYRAFAKIPLEIREVLAQASLVKAMISMKDKDGHRLAMESLRNAERSASTLISPRIDNETKKIVNRSPLFRTNRSGWGR